MARPRPPFLGEDNDIRAWLSGVAVSISDPLLLKAMWMLDRWTGTGTDKILKASEKPQINAQNVTINVYREPPPILLDIIDGEVKDA